MSSLCTNCGAIKRPLTIHLEPSCACLVDWKGSMVDYSFLPNNNHTGKIVLGKNLKIGDFIRLKSWFRSKRVLHVQQLTKNNPVAEKYWGAFLIVLEDATEFVVQPYQNITVIHPINSNTRNGKKL